MCYGIEKGAIAQRTAAKTIAEFIGGLLFCSLFDPIMLCDEAPSADILLSTTTYKYRYTTVQYNMVYNKISLQYFYNV